jgi:hypothetical protein
MKGFNAPSQVTNQAYAWRDDFTYGAVSPFTGNANWTVTSGVGQTVALTAHALTMATGTGNTSGTSVVQSTQSFSVPFQVQFEWLKGNSSISGFTLYLELVNQNGDMAASTMIIGTDISNYLVRTTNAGTNSSTISFSAVNVLTYNNLIIQLWPDEVRWIAKSTDSGSGSVKSLKQGTKVPDPQQQYYIRITLVNTANISTSVTNSFDSITVRDLSYLSVDFNSAGLQDIQSASPILITNPSSSPVQTVLSSSPIVTIQGNSNASTFITGNVTTTTPLLTSAINLVSYVMPIIRASCISDQAGVLSILASSDSFTTSYTANSVTIPTGGAYAYCETKLINGNAAYQFKSQFKNNGTATTTKFRMDIGSTSI